LELKSENMLVTEILKRENNNLDLVRIILACMVILGHTSTLNGATIDPFNYISRFTELENPTSLAVKLFFFISGLVVANSLLKSKSAFSFLIARFFRLMPALFVTLVVTALIIGPIVTAAPLAKYFSHEHTYLYIYKNMVFDFWAFLPWVFENNAQRQWVNGSLWTLAYEVSCYLFLLGTFLVFNKQTRFMTWVAVVVIIDSFSPVKLLFGWMGTNPDIVLLPPVFAFGTLFAINAEKIKLDLNMVLGFLLAYFTFRGTPFAHLLFIMLCSVAVLYLSSRKLFIKLKPKLDISYGVYLWGFVIQQTMYYYLGNINSGLHFLLSVVLAAIAGTLSSIIVEKPFIRLGRKLIARRSLAS